MERWLPLWGNDYVTLERLVTSWPPLQRTNGLKDSWVFDQIESRRRNGQACESGGGGGGALAGNMMEITQLHSFFPPPLLKTPKSLKIANSLCGVNPQNAPRARLFKRSWNPQGSDSTFLTARSCCLVTKENCHHLSQAEGNRKTRCYWKWIY